MATFCQTGDIARVTFPDGSIRDFVDTPITIEAGDETGNRCEILRVIYSYYERVFVFVNNRWQERWQRVLVQNVEVYGPFYGIYFKSSNNVENIFCLCHDRHPFRVCSSLPREVAFPADSNRKRQLELLTLIKVSDGQPVPPMYRIKVTGSGGSVLFSALFNNSSYSVECIQGCPPNTLDCGDCCLDCNSIFNQISGIRALLSRLK